MPLAQSLPLVPPVRRIRRVANDVEHERAHVFPAVCGETGGHVLDKANAKQERRKVGIAVIAARKPEPVPAHALGMTSTNATVPTPKEAPLPVKPANPVRATPVFNAVSMDV